MQLNVGVAQMHPVIGDIPTNLARHLDAIDRAKAQAVDLLVFPELALTGYNGQDLMAGLAIQPTAADPAFRVLLEASQGLDLVVGFVYEDRRHRLYNAAAYLSGGEVRHIHDKLYPPLYAPVDGGRYFAQGDRVRAFDTRFGRMGMLIGADFWHASPPYLLWLDGADVLLLLSASPGRGLDNDDRLASARWVERVQRAYASLFTDYVIHANRIGYEDGVNFWGGSMITNPEGEVLAQAPYFEEALLVQTIDLSQLHRTRERLPLLQHERAELLERELARLLHAPDAPPRQP